MSYIYDNIGKGVLIKVEQNGFEQKAPPEAFVNKSLAFTGVFDLSTPFGTFWNDLSQTAAITLSVGGYAKVGGVDRVKITANGAAITVPATFTNIGTDSISIVNGTINIIYVVKTGSNTYDYTVKNI